MEKKIGSPDFTESRLRLENYIWQFPDIRSISRYLSIINIHILKNKITENNPETVHFFKHYTFSPNSNEVQKI